MSIKSLAFGFKFLICLIRGEFLMEFPWCWRVSSGATLLILYYFMGRVLTKVENMGRCLLVSSISCCWSGPIGNGVESSSFISILRVELLQLVPLVSV